MDELEQASDADVQKIEKLTEAMGYEHTSELMSMAYKRVAEALASDRDEVDVDEVLSAALNQLWDETDTGGEENPEEKAEAGEEVAAGAVVGGGTNRRNAYGTGVQGGGS